MASRFSFRRLALIAAALAALLTSCSTTLTLNEAATTTRIAPTTTEPTTTQTPATVARTEAPPTTIRFSELPTVSIDELPPEALDTLILIRNGGPYPYRQDDGVFQNREGILPDHPRGHYREYTIETPGSPDRGARRFVVGERGEIYYTDDHYSSFREVTSGGDR
ncbi:MAG: guanine-specific ribonuclease N1 and T1 [Acidimicrobiales bacterium]|nr:guanine-specific ribonuclease N1 and T1 [Acidimicrobiales bacterium]